MHELGIMYNVVKTVLQTAQKNNVTHIEKLVLQIGEVSPVVPRYIKACFAPAVDHTIMENTILEIEQIKAIACCENCRTQYALVEHKAVCPQCACKHYELLSGKEFMIKEIHAI